MFFHRSVFYDNTKQCDLYCISNLYFPLLQICWNPNFGSHQWLAVAGQAGIVRLLYFEAVET